MGGLRKKAGRRLAGFFDLPGEIFPRASTASLTSDRELLVTGCRRICEYGLDRVVLALTDVELTVCGEGLTMRAFFGSQIEIRGRIKSIEVR